MYILLISLLISSASATEHRKQIAVVDTGITKTPFIQKYLCRDGHADFTGKGLADTHGHGTNVANIIAKYMNPETHCLLIVKFYLDENDPTVNESNLLNSFKYLSYKNISYLNLSGGGKVYNHTERSYVAGMLNRGVVIAVAAGNNKTNLNHTCSYFPACYNFSNSNFWVVANASLGSNYGGPVDVTENGNDIEAGGVTLSGSSQACAIAMGKIVSGVYVK